MGVIGSGADSNGSRIKLRREEAFSHYLLKWAMLHWLHPVGQVMHAQLALIFKELVGRTCRWHLHLF